MTYAGCFICCWPCWSYCSPPSWISSTKSSSFPLTNTVDLSTIVKFAIRLGSIYFASSADIFKTFLEYRSDIKELIDKNNLEPLYKTGIFAMKGGLKSDKFFDVLYHED